MTKRIGKKKKLYSDVVKSLASSFEKAPENRNTAAALKKIRSILLRYENLNSFIIQNSPPDI